MLVISNTSWMIKLASVVFNYINYMEKHYQKLYKDIIYPAIYQKKYDEDNIDSIEDNELDTSSDFIDKSNKYARDKNKFKIGNKMNRYSQQKLKNEQEQKNKSQNLSIFDNNIDDMEEEEE